MFFGVSRRKGLTRGSFKLPGRESPTGDGAPAERRVLRLDEYHWRRPGQTVGISQTKMRRRQTNVPKARTWFMGQDPFLRTIDQPLAGRLLPNGVG